MFGFILAFNHLITTSNPIKTSISIRQESSPSPNYSPTPSPIHSSSSASPSNNSSSSHPNPQAVTSPASSLTQPPKAVVPQATVVQPSPKPHVTPSTVPSASPSQIPQPEFPTAAGNPSSRYGHFFYAEAFESDLIRVGDHNGRSEFLHWEAAAAYQQMRQAAEVDGIQLMPISGFRDINVQADLFEAQIVRRGSESAAARISAPPGYSEHHTGYAIDLGDAQYPETDLEVTFDQTPAFGWLSRHAYQFGFEMSFPAGNAQGISYEPWHWRFVASPHSAQVFAQAQP
jgi:D-alanyl-D-alanine carboxypeptidase